MATRIRLKFIMIEPLCHAYLSRAASIEIATTTMLRRTVAPT